MPFYIKELQPNLNILTNAIVSDNKLNPMKIPGLTSLLFIKMG